MTSIYDEEVIAELRAQQREAEASAKQHAEQAADRMRDAAGQRSRARQFEALLAHAEGRHVEHQEITQQAERINSHGTALRAALNLLAAGLPPAWSWDVYGHRGATLQIHLEGTGERELTALATWARFLDTEVVEETHGDRIRYHVNAEYLGASIEITVLSNVPAPKQAPAESEASE